MLSSPYVVGQWVRGKRFYGRGGLLEEILEGPRNWMWLLGTRRLGKTSLLRQVEYLTADSSKSGYFPVYWDFQGSETPDELHMGFSDALLDAEDRLAEIGVEYDEGEQDMFRALSGLRRKLGAKGLRLLLLCDEVEELIKLDERDPSLLRKLRRAMQSKEDVRSVLASTIRLWALSDRQEDTSPFLHGFLPPLYIGTLAPQEARALIRQTQLPEASRPTLDDETVETIRAHCADHPYLLQLVSKRVAELGDVHEAIDLIATDPMVSYFFSVDFEMLTDAEKSILRVVADQSAATSNTLEGHLPLATDRLDGLLQRLEQLSFVSRDSDRRFVLANYFFRRWFRERPSAKAPSSSVADTKPSMVGIGLDVPDPTPSGVIDDRYTLIEQVGRGATGTVFKAHDRLLRVDIALKLLRPEFSANPEAFERYRQEIVLAREIVHPNVVTVYHLGEFGDRTYLTLQWVEGTTLAHMIDRQAPLEPSRTTVIARKLAGALEALHARKVLHRDIKPHNIMIDTAGDPHLTDFGLARLVGEPGMTSAGIFLGTPTYASPEQARLLPLDERSDLYSLGLVIFEMCTGKRAFVAATSAEVLEMHRSAPAPTARDVHPAVLPELSAIIARCLEKDPKHRFASAVELSLALARLPGNPDVTLTTV